MEKPIFTEKCQLMSVEKNVKLEIHYVEIIIVIFDSGANHQWILKLEGEYLMRQDIYKVSKYLSTRNLLIMKGEIVIL